MEWFDVITLIHHYSSNRRCQNSNQVNVFNMQRYSTVFEQQQRGRKSKQ